MFRIRIRNILIIEMQRLELGHTLQAAVITKIPEEKIEKTKLGIKASMHLVKLTSRKTGKQCLPRKAQQIKLEGMNILTGMRDLGLLHGTRSKPEAELHLGHVEVMPEEIGMNPEGCIQATTDTGEADLR